MRYSDCQIVFQEIPNEISLAYQMTGCPLRCLGCHSSDLWKTQSGQELKIESLKRDIEKYKNFISCVLFLGGEWELEELLTLLDYVKSCNLKTALYTGLELNQIDQQLRNKLDYLKYGSYQAELGALTSPLTNQKLVNLKTNENLNHYFIQGGYDDSIRC